MSEILKFMALLKKPFKYFTWRFICFLAFKFTLLKFDLDKAYDWLKWDFIREKPEFFHIPESLRKLTMNTITST